MHSETNLLGVPNASVNPSEFVSIIKNIIELTTSDNIGRMFTFVGIVMIFFAGGVAYKLVRSDPSTIPAWQKVMMWSTGVLGILFLIAGPSLSLYIEGRQTAILLANQNRTFDEFIKNEIKPDDILSNLRNNRRVSTFIRLIAYDPVEQPELALERLTYVGPTSQRYSFVSDYDELRGITGAEALKRSGIAFKPSQKISALIFPADQAKEIIPLNARGLLQVIDSVEKNNSVKLPFEISKKIGLSAFEALKDKARISGWSWNEYKKYYNEYCEQAYEFRCNPDKYTASSLIGSLTYDWHPLGYAENAASAENICQNPVAKQKTCDINEWPSSEENLKQKVGVRVFMIPNIPISSIRGRILVDFSNPSTQRIPSLLPDGISAQSFFGTTNSARISIVR